MRSDWINTDSFVSLGVFSEKKDVALAFWAGWLVPSWLFPCFLNTQLIPAGMSSIGGLHRIDPFFWVLGMKECPYEIVAD
jgi:hypothetical protein